MSINALKVIEGPWLSIYTECSGVVRVWCVGDAKLKENNLTVTSKNTVFRSWMISSNKQWETPICRLAVNMEFAFHIHIHIHRFSVDIHGYIHIHRRLSCVHSHQIFAKYSSARASIPPGISFVDLLKINKSKKIKHICIEIWF